MLESKDAVSQRHQREWRAFIDFFGIPEYAAMDLDRAKLAKALADTLKIYQEGERKAYGFADADQALPAGPLGVEWEE